MLFFSRHWCMDSARTREQQRAWMCKMCKSLQNDLCASREIAPRQKETKSMSRSETVFCVSLLQTSSETYNFVLFHSFPPSVLTAIRFPLQTRASDKIHIYYTRAILYNLAVLIMSREKERHFVNGFAVVLRFAPVFTVLKKQFKNVDYFLFRMLRRFCPSCVFFFHFKPHY